MDVLQYFVVGFIVIIVFLFQVKTFISNDVRIKRIKHLFPSSNLTSVKVDEDNTTSIETEEGSTEFKDTIADINSYLSNNKNKTFDYQILKEIVNRNSQSLEGEVDTMITVPLYLGLIATILGIAFGVIFFAWEDLAGLLTGATLDPKGIKILLTDIGIAMFASFAGVLATALSTSSYNKARTEMVKNKNLFLTWIQTDLMSKLSDDITGALLKMTHDLNEFNRTFADNTRELKETLSTVKDNYEGQVKLLNAIDRLKINRIARANIEVYDRLQGCTEELERLFEIFANSEEYLNKVVELNNNIGSVEERTRLFEELGNYFKNEMEHVRERQGMMRQQMSSLDSVLQEALSNLGNSVSESIAELTGKFQQQNDQIQHLIEEQQNSLTESLQRQQQAVDEKIGQIGNPFEGLKEMFEEGIRSMQSAFTEQNAAIREVLASQTASLEQALSSQQQAIVRKLQKTPGHMQAFADLTKVLNKLDETLGHRDVPVPVNGERGGKGKAKKSLMGFIKSYYLPICACGSFLSLLVLLIMRLLGL